jgi:hypothetical protein
VQRVLFYDDQGKRFNQRRFDPTGFRSAIPHHRELMRFENRQVLPNRRGETKNTRIRFFISRFSSFVTPFEELHKNWTLVLRFQVPGVSSKKARAGLKPDTRHLKPMLREGFTTSDNVQKKTYFSDILRDL